MWRTLNDQIFCSNEMTPRLGCGLCYQYRRVSAQSPAQFRCSSALLAAAAAFIDPTSGREPGPSQSQQPGTRTRLQQPDMQHIDTTSIYPIFGTLVTRLMIFDNQTRPPIDGGYQNNCPKCAQFYFYSFTPTISECFSEHCEFVTINFRAQSSPTASIMCEDQCPHCT